MIPRETELEIVRKYDVEKLHIGTIARQLGVHPCAVRRALRDSCIVPSNRKQRQKRIDEYLPLVDDLLIKFPAITTTQLFNIVIKKGFVGSPSHFRQVLLVYRRKGGVESKCTGTERRRREWLEWLYLLERDQLPRLDDFDEVNRQKVISYLKRAKRYDRQKALVILAHQQLFSNATIARCLGISQNTIRGYIRKFVDTGVDGVFERKELPLKSGNEDLKKAVFGLLHEPPSLSGVNRTSWKMDDLQRVLAARGQVACKDVIRRIIKDAGFKWRNARTVLTSNDPKYREKVERLHATLSNLTIGERFFSIDEFGPFAIKTTGGRVLAAPGTQPTIPQWQKSRGSLILTAALELSTNQVTYFYSTAKNTAEMIKMAELLVDKYQDEKRLFLSWDAASWHISKVLKEFVANHNAIADLAEVPQLDLLPLPAGAQFLNVIESVFSGMARAIIHNSNYVSAVDATAAIDRYLNERNLHFLEHPKKAGSKVWRLERTSASFHPSNNCKDPAYR